MEEFWISLLNVVNTMSPYLLLGFLIAGILHVFVPKRFYANYLSRDNKLSVLWAALLGIPLPLCSCGVIPTAIGLKNERASKSAVGSFLIATPQPASPDIFRIVCSCLLVIFIINALSMKLFSRFKKKEVVEGTTRYCVEGMHCNHCKAAVEQAGFEFRGRDGKAT